MLNRQIDEKKFKPNLNRTEYFTSDRNAVFEESFCLRASTKRKAV
jgi:hypothetical protein